MPSNHAESNQSNQSNHTNAIRLRAKECTEALDGFRRAAAELTIACWPKELQQTMHKFKDATDLFVTQQKNLIDSTTEYICNMEEDEKEEKGVQNIIYLFAFVGLLTISYLVFYGGYIVLRAISGVVQ